MLYTHLDGISGNYTLPLLMRGGRGGQEVACWNLYQWVYHIYLETLLKQVQGQN